jgi:hypothetical protein
MCPTRFSNYGNGMRYPILLFCAEEQLFINAHNLLNDPVRSPTTYYRNGFKKWRGFRDLSVPWVPRSRVWKLHHAGHA